MLIITGELKGTGIWYAYPYPAGWCTDFIFTLGEVAEAVEKESLIMQPYRSYFVGPMTKFSELVTYAESIHMFGIRFLPLRVVLLHKVAFA